MKIDKKRMLLWIIAITLITVVGVIVVVLIGKGAYRNETEDPAKLAQEVLVPKISVAFADIDLSGEDEPAFLESLETTQTFDIHSATTNDNGDIEVKLTVAAPDLAWVFEDLKTSTASTEDEMNAAIEQSVAKAPKREETVTVSFYNNNGEWEPLLTDSLFNAYYGGVLDLWEKLLGGDTDA